GLPAAPAPAKSGAPDGCGLCVPWPQPTAAITAKTTALQHPRMGALVAFSRRYVARFSAQSKGRRPSRWRVLTELPVLALVGAAARARPGSLAAVEFPGPSLGRPADRKCQPEHLIRFESRLGWAFAMLSCLR